ncbi:hypothetical protein GUJ93_ZPchr0005g16304 [Zizania palustris]|uniref:Uncharacterized protein n=1 Tax=Zizania palustris TaxID=103762 RepID=A0A8J5W1R6_ZIZPA|nr:hypothetical protein GUJ93_ZPchr0005g16304 [Zizania palustris]
MLLPSVAIAPAPSRRHHHCSCLEPTSSSLLSSHVDADAPNPSLRCRSCLESSPPLPLPSHGLMRSRG